MKALEDGEYTKAQQRFKKIAGLKADSINDCMLHAFSYVYLGMMLIGIGAPAIANPVGKRHFIYSGASR